MRLGPITRTITQCIWAGVPLLVSALLLAVHPFGGALVGDVVGLGAVLLLGFLIWRRRRLRSVPDVIFLAASVATLAYVFLSGMLEIPVTPVPQMRTFLKVSFALSVLLLLYLFSRGATRTTLLITTAFLGSNLLLTWHLQGITLRALPLVSYLFFGFGFASSERQPSLAFSWRDAVPVALFLLVIISAARSPIKGGGVHVAFASLAALIVYWGARFSDDAETESQLASLRMAFSLVVLAMVVFAIISVWRTGSLLANGALAGFNPNGVAGYSAILLPLSVGAAAAKGRGSRVGWGLLAVAGFGLIVACGSRTSLLASVVGSAFVVCAHILLQYQREMPKLSAYSRRIAAVVVILVLVAAAAIGVFRLKGWESVLARKSIWTMYAHNAWTHGGLFGFGPEAYAANLALSPSFLSAPDRAAVEGFVRAFGENTHAHNLLIQAWFDLGPFGPILLLIAALIAVSLALRRKWSEEGISVAGSLLALAAHSVMEFSLADTAIILPVAFALGIWFRRSEGRTPTLHVAWSVSRSFWTALALPLLGAIAYLSYNFTTVQAMRRVLGASLQSAHSGRFSVPGGLTFDQQQRLLALDNMFLFNFYDWRVESLRGAIHLSLAEQGRSTLAVAGERFRACINLHRYSTACTAGLADTLEREGRLPESRELRARALALDPWGFGR